MQDGWAAWVCAGNNPRWRQSGNGLPCCGRTMSSSVQRPRQPGNAQKRPAPCAGCDLTIPCGAERSRILRDWAQADRMTLIVVVAHVAGCDAGSLAAASAEPRCVVSREADP